MNSHLESWALWTVQRKDHRARVRPPLDSKFAIAWRHLAAIVGSEYIKKLKHLSWVIIITSTITIIIISMHVLIIHCHTMFMRVHLTFNLFVQFPCYCYVLFNLHVLSKVFMQFSCVFSIIIIIIFLCKFQTFSSSSSSTFPPIFDRGPFAGQKTTKGVGRLHYELQPHMGPHIGPQVGPLLGPRGSWGGWKKRLWPLEWAGMESGQKDFFPLHRGEDKRSNKKQLKKLKYRGH